MADTLLGFALARLAQITNPVFLHRELERFPPSELKSLLSAGVLRETSKATEIPRPRRLPPGGDLIVRETAKGFVGVAGEDDYFQSIPLVEDDIRQYELVLSKLISLIRQANELKGVPVENRKLLFLAGEYSLPGRQHADVYLSLGHYGPTEFVSLCKTVLPEDRRPVVMLVPTQLPLRADAAQLLSSWQVFVVSLMTHLDRRSWKLPWDQIFKSASKTTAVSTVPSATYCQVITREGTRSINKSQYESLLKSRDQYGMFIDGTTGWSRCAHGKTKPRLEKLTAREFAMLREYIQAGRPMRPQSTTTGGNCASQSAARRLFEEARKKSDVKLGRFGFRAFRLHKNPADPRLNSFEFSPPDDLKYCLVVPL